MPTLWTLLQAFLLFLNGVAIINNERFLEKYGWGFSQMGSGNSIGPSPGTLKLQVIGFIHAAKFMRWPLIIANIVVILVKMVFG
ncbi:hypothetical protein WJX73_002668 [Symbiochloris irregularis]|uniref:Yos1-like protein n=1 Tax=Symbiochloris irregularis TaxID=706552 RepID=A0AAW1PVU0_9CHLO